MSIDGNWNLSISSAQGSQQASLKVKEDNGTLTGEMNGSLGMHPLQNGAINGNDVSWDIDIAQPQLHIEFSGSVEGDSISGTVNMGQFGNGSFSGQRS